SLHYYFPWAIMALAKWAIFCATTERKMRIDQDTVNYFSIGDRSDMSYEEKIAAYAQLADEYFETDRYNEFCAKHLPHIEEATIEFVESPGFDELLVDTVKTTFPVHEHDNFIPHYRGLLAAWASDRKATAG
ncbi:MAG: hypothetical protein ACRDI3_00905, partial [Actinomycetota bacterium]